MLHSFLKIAWRNLLRNKGFSFLNITGLAIGIAATILIMLWVVYELRFDAFHSNRERIYEVYNKDKHEGEIYCWNTSPKVMASAISRDYPEVDKTTRVNWSLPSLFSVGDKRIKVSGNVVDSTFLDIFSFPLLKGNVRTALQGTNSVVITASLATKLFGTDEAMGKTVLLDNSDNFTVTGVLKDLPNNTSFDFEFLVPWAYARLRGWDDENWNNNSTRTFVMLKSSNALVDIAPKIKTMRKKYDSESPQMETILYPFSRSYLYGSFKNGIEEGGRMDVIKMFGIIAAFILLIACINFMNLSTARSERRAKEVGIRKVVGAQKQSLIGQFIGESVLLSFFACLLALIIVWISLPFFNTLVEKQLVLDMSNKWFWIAGAAIILFTGLLAGSYPALYLSSFKPVSVLKGVFKKQHALIAPRKILVVLQFTFAIALIICTIIVRQQLEHAQNRTAGYNKNNLMYSFMEGDAEKNYNLIKQDLLQSGIAVSVTKTSSPITEGWSNTWGIGWLGKRDNDRTIVDRLSADDAFVQTAGLQLIEGRDFDLKNFPADSSAAIINESAVKLMEFKKPIGQILKDNGRDWHVIGVIKDFVLKSPFQPVEPMMIAGAHGWFNVIHMKMNPKLSTSDAIKRAEVVFKKYNPEYPFNYSFADEVYAKKFNNEKRTGKLAQLFALLTIIISCLGLFGLASYMAENRVKEIGIRKVLGASVAGITALLSVDFLKLVLISFVIAAPIAWWAMHEWLSSYPYRIQIQWWVFVLAGTGALCIAFATVSFQAIKAAIVNPVLSLRSE